MHNHQLDVLISMHNLSMRQLNMESSECILVSRRPWEVRLRVSHIL